MEMENVSYNAYGSSAAGGVNSYTISSSSCCQCSGSACCHVGPCQYCTVHAGGGWIPLPNTSPYPLVPGGIGVGIGTSPTPTFQFFPEPKRCFICEKELEVLSEKKICDGCFEMFQAFKEIMNVEERVTRKKKGLKKK